jgi:ankyrin repeat protein
MSKILLFPLHSAVQSGDIAAVRDLLNVSSISPFVVDINGRTPLHHAANYGKTKYNSCQIFANLYYNYLQLINRHHLH